MDFHYNALMVVSNDAFFCNSTLIIETLWTMNENLIYVVAGCEEEHDVSFVAHFNWGTVFKVHLMFAMINCTSLNIMQRVVGKGQC